MFDTIRRILTTWGAAASRVDKRSPGQSLDNMRGSSNMDVGPRHARPPTTTVPQEAKEEPTMNTLCFKRETAHREFGPDINRLVKEMKRKEGGLSSAQLKIITSSKISAKQLNEIGRKANLLGSGK